MPFDDTDLANMLEAFDPVEITVKLNGATVDTISGRFRRRTEMASPHDAETVVIIPSVLCRESDLQNVDRSNTLTIGGKTYKIYGDPEPMNSGFCRVGLVKA